MNSVESSLRYSLLHTWARLDSEGTVTVGITTYAQYELGEIQYAGLPRVGALVKKDAAFGELESAKTVSDVYAPCSGTVVAVNAALIDDPAIINRDPYGDGWIVRVQPSDVAELDALVDHASYEAHAGAQTH